MYYKKKTLSTIIITIVGDYIDERKDQADGRKANPKLFSFTILELGAITVDSASPHTVSVGKGEGSLFSV